MHSQVCSALNNLISFVLFCFKNNILLTAKKQKLLFRVNNIDCDRAGPDPYMAIVTRKNGTDKLLMSIYNLRM